MTRRRTVLFTGARTAVVVALIAVFSVTSIGVDSASASESDTIASLVNEARWSAGLPGLIHNHELDAVALNWANHMAAANDMIHNPDFAGQIPAGWSSAGENIALGHPTPSAMHTGWMNSEGHRANILGDFTDVGIAFITVNGTTWGVEDFGKYAGHVGPSAPAPAPAAAPAPVAPPAPVASPEPTSTPIPSATVATVPRRVTKSAISSSDAWSRGSESRGSESSGPKSNGSTASGSKSPSAEVMTLSAATSAIQSPFLIGYLVGGLILMLGIGGGLYGQRLRFRGRRRHRA